MEKKVEGLEALPVDDGGACLVVLLLGDPHLLEGGQGSQDGATDPDGVLPLWGGDDLERRRRGSSGLIIAQTCDVTKSTGRSVGTQPFGWGVGTQPNNI